MKKQKVPKHEWVIFFEHDHRFHSRRSSHPAILPYMPPGRLTKIVCMIDVGNAFFEIALVAMRKLAAGIHGRWLKRADPGPTQKT